MEDPREKDYFADLLEELEDGEENEGEGTEEKKGDENETGEEGSNETLTEEEQRKKNTDAEEARKRREKEAKEKAEAEAKAKAEAEAERETKEKDRVNKLGEQLVDFKKKYPDIDLAELDNDANFKTFIDGKLLGKKDFTQLYESYVSFNKNVSGRSEEEIRKSYERKRDAGSGSSGGSGTTPPDVYSEEELKKLSDKIPFMQYKDYAKIEAKLRKSIEFYKKQK